MNGITGTTLSVWTDTYSCPLVPLQGNHHQQPSAITLPAKHPATVILVLSRELILFVMRCLMCCWVGSRDSVTLNLIAGNLLWLSTPHYLLMGYFMLTTACHHIAHLEGNRLQRWIQIYRTMHIYSQLTLNWQLELLGFRMPTWCEYYIVAVTIA